MATPRLDARFPALDPKLVTRVEWAVCIFATLAAAVLHILFLAHAGALWRDEAGGVGLATVPTLREMWTMLAHDSFPVLFPAVIRFWTAIGLGHTDLGLRCLGFLLGLGLLGMLWVSARVLGYRLPLFSLALLSVNLTPVIWGDSLRAYGLASVLILATLCLVWRLMRVPNLERFLAASGAALLSVQCLYSNAFLLLAICIAGCFVCFRCKQDRAALWVIGVGAVAALSLVPYFGPLQRSQQWWIVEKAGIYGAVVLANLLEALGSPMIWLAGVWIILSPIAVGWGFLSMKTEDRKRPISTDELPPFAALILCFGTVTFFLFLLIAKLPTQPWYWLPLMVLAAVCIDSTFAVAFREHRVWRTVVILLLVIIPLPWAITESGCRKTNIDLVAAKIATDAAPNDLVLVYPWYHGVSFSRYYKGRAPWTTLPPLTDFRFHRYDLLKEQLGATRPIKPVLDKIAATIAGGNRVWVVGDFPSPEPGETAPPDLPPAPEGPNGWFDVPYTYAWGRQAQHLLQGQAGKLKPIAIGKGRCVSRFEDVSLSVAPSWTVSQ
jgi:hypothetical protein